MSAVVPSKAASGRLPSKRAPKPSQSTASAEKVPPSADAGVRMTRPVVEKLHEDAGDSEFALDLQGQKFCTVEGLEAFPKLRTLDLSWNMLETIHGLDSLKLLKELKLYRNKLTTTEGLKELKSLEHLHLHSNAITAITPDFESLRALTFLRLDRNALTRIANLDRLGNLTYLDLSCNRIKEAQGFRHLRSLETLLLNQNELKGWGDIPACVSLQSLEASGNVIPSLKGLATLVNLTELSCGSNALVNLALDDTGSARLGFLRSLSVPGNQIASLAGLLAFPCLESLDIGNNGVRFDDIQAFTSTLTCLESLSIEGNPRPIPADYVSVLKTALPSLETLDSKPIVEVAGSVGEFGLRPGTASGVRPGSSAGQRRPSTPSTQTGPFTLGRPPSSASLRPSSAAGQRPTTPSFGDGSAGSPRSARPTMKTSLSKSGPLAHVVSNEELTASVAKAQAKIYEMRTAMYERLKQLGAAPPTRPVVAPPPVPLATPSTTPSAVSAKAAPSDAAARPPSGLKQSASQKPKGKGGVAAPASPAPAPSVAAPKPAPRPTSSVDSPKKSHSGVRRTVAEPAPAPNPLFSFSPTPYKPVGEESVSKGEPAFIKSTRRRDNSTGKLLPIPVDPPLVDCEEPEPPAAASIPRPATTGAGPSLRPSTSAAVSVALGVRFSLPSETPSGSQSARKLNLVPDSIITSPRYVPEKTAELRGRPAQARHGVGKFKIPAQAKVEIVSKMLPSASSLSILSAKAPNVLPPGSPPPK